MAKIMTVDDDAFARMLCARMLDEKGYEVIEASSGPEGIEKYGETRPDAVLLDITMPDMDGIETLDKILELDPAAKVIMVTAVAQQADVVKALKGGAMDYVLKPFDAQRLGAALDGAILEKNKLC